MRNIKLLFIFSLFLASCKTEGPEGKAGVDGKDGNANVKSQIITVNPSDWQGNEIYGFEAQKLATIITQDIVNNGMVLCYLQDGNRYYSLPFSSPITLEYEEGLYGWTRHFSFSHALNAAYFIIQDDDRLTEAPQIPFVFKIIAAPASSLVSSVDINNYQEVATALGIE